MISYRQSDLFKRLKEIRWMKNPFMHPNEPIAADWDLERMGKRAGESYFNHFITLEDYDNEFSHNVLLVGDARKTHIYFYNKEFDIVVMVRFDISKLPEKLDIIYRLFKEGKQDSIKNELKRLE